MNPQLRNFALAVLDDDNGISETAWKQLNILLQGAGEFELIGELSAQVDACDGRFFLNIPVCSDTLKAWADEKEDYGHLLDLAQCSEV